MKKKKTKVSEDKPTLIAFLLDRSGSMSSCLAETISGFNAYLDELGKNRRGEIRFTLTQFDSMAVDIIYRAALLKNVPRLNAHNYQPRSMTPLHDAIGKTIRATEKDAGKKFKVLFVTLTDGLENASSEWNATSIKTLIKEKEASGWTFADIGVSAEGWQSAQQTRSGTQSAGNIICTSAANVKKSFVNLARATASYANNPMAEKICITDFYAGVDKDLK